MKELIILANYAKRKVIKLTNTQKQSIPINLYALWVRLSFYGILFRQNYICFLGLSGINHHLCEVLSKKKSSKIIKTLLSFLVNDVKKLSQSNILV